MAEILFSMVLISLAACAGNCWRAAIRIESKEAGFTEWGSAFAPAIGAVAPSLLGGTVLPPKYNIAIRAIAIAMEM